MRLLFVKERLAWPRTSGHDVHAYYMMQSIQRLGHEVALVTRDRVPEAVEGLPLAAWWTLGELPDAGPLPTTRLQAKFLSYWGIDLRDLGAVASAVARFNADVLVPVGLDCLPYVAAASNARAVWYAADEWFLHHMSLVKAGQPATWQHVKSAFIKLLYERAFAPRVDRVWVVSEADRRAAIRWAGIPRADVLPNGVDTRYFAPAGGSRDTKPRSCVFWGRLDFEPNIDALTWFLGAVWPLVRHQHPDALLRIIGANPGPLAQSWRDVPGVELHTDVPDLRPLLQDMQVVVLPFVSGAGIKNKLLEAAALAKPVICTPRSLGGLRGSPPMITAGSPADWSASLHRLWLDPELCAGNGSAARAWVLENHAWETSAQTAMDALSR